MHLTLQNTFKIEQLPGKGLPELSKNLHAPLPEHTRSGTLVMHVLLGARQWPPTQTSYRQSPCCRQASPTLPMTYVVSTAPLEGPNVGALFEGPFVGPRVGLAVVPSKSTAMSFRPCLLTTRWHLALAFPNTPMKPALHAPHVFGVSTHGPRLSAVQLGACEQFVMLIDDDTALIKPRTASAFPDDNADVMPPFRNFEGFTDAFTTTAISALVLAWERYTSKARAMMVTLPSRAWRPAGSCAVTDGTGPTPRMISGGTLVETASLHVRGNGAEEMVRQC